MTPAGWLGATLDDSGRGSLQMAAAALEMTGILLHLGQKSHVWLTNQARVTNFGVNGSVQELH